MNELRAWAAGILTLVTIIGCGDGNTTSNSPPPPPATPAATLQVSGNGNIIVHPSADPAFGFALEFPISIQETSGGTAIWNFFRVSYLKTGLEIERSEQGADAIQSAGYRNIGARATITARIIVRSNSLDWDDLRLVLGFTDNKDARTFEQSLSLDSFEGVLLSLTPALIPDGSSFAIVRDSGE